MSATVFAVLVFVFAFVTVGGVISAMRDHAKLQAESRARDGEAPERVLPRMEEAHG